MRKIIFALLLSVIYCFGNAQQLAVMKYKGGGDWYSNPTSLPNLVAYCNEVLNTKLSDDIATVEPASVDIFQYPFVHVTGHGNILFDQDERENLRNYLLSGGFIHVDDNYGMEPYLKKELKELFPDKVLTELPANHPIFNNYASFPDGLPKIHEHKGERPQALGLFHEGRLIFLFTVESDLGDGWESPEVHNDPPEVRIKALDMGANIIKYVFSS
jgi:hypothetical protein